MHPDSGSDYYSRVLAAEETPESRLEKSRLIAEICREALESAGRAVDLGCGSGLILRALEERFSRTIFGVDNDRARVKTSAGIVLADLEAIPFVDASFDFALCNHVFEHVARQEKFLREVRRVLKSGGLAYFTVGNRFQPLEPHYRLPLLSWLPKAPAALYLRATRRGRGYGHINFPDYWKLNRMAREAGFRVTDVTLRVLQAGRERIRERWRQAVVRLVLWVPAFFAGWALKLFSPHWFFFFHAEDSPERVE
jgi:ubiquinone/menaquinone biosynthesis C-methylase UbiE